MTTLQKTLAALIAAQIAIPHQVEAAPSNLSVNYQNYRNGHTYRNSDLDRDFKAVTRHGNIGDGNQKISVFPSQSNYKRFQVNLKAGEFGGDQLTAVRVDLAPRNVYTLGYRVRFAKNFDFGRGGKLPGISGGSGPTGGRPANDGMSHRIMWIVDRRDPSDIQFQAYHYHLAQHDAWVRGGRTNTRRYGDSTKFMPIKDATWYNIQMQVKLDTGEGRGRLHINVNGVTRYNHTHRYLRNGANWKLNRFLKVIFYGGGTQDWAPTRNTNLLLDNIKINQEQLPDSRR